MVSRSGYPTQTRRYGKALPSAKPYARDVTSKGALSLRGADGSNRIALPSSTTRISSFHQAPNDEDAASARSLGRPLVPLRPRHFIRTPKSAHHRPHRPTVLDAANSLPTPPGRLDCTLVGALACLQLQRVRLGQHHLLLTASRPCVAIKVVNFSFPFFPSPFGFFPLSWDFALPKVDHSH